MKKLKKYSTKLYKKIPKKKVAVKAVSMGADFIGVTPYVKVAKYIVKRNKKKALSYAGSYAYDKVLRSLYIRDKINTLPMLVLTMIIRNIFAALLISNLQTGIYYLNFAISIILTSLITLLSPFFYKSIKAHEELFLQLTNNFMDRFMKPDGWEFIELSKNIVMGILGALFFILLFFMEITSSYIQEMIIHTMISNIISENMQKYLDKHFNPVKCIKYIQIDKLKANTDIEICHVKMGKPKRAIEMSKRNIDIIKYYQTAGNNNRK